MRPYVISMAAVLLLSFSAQAQQSATTKKKVKKEQIIIRKRTDGSKEEKTTIVIDGDKVTINGKPANEWNGGDVVVQRTDSDFGDGFILHEAPGAPTPPAFSFEPRGGVNFYNGSMLHAIAGNKVALGVYSESNEKGAAIVRLVDSSAAVEAGLKEGDVITKVGEAKVSGPESLSEAIGKYSKPEEVTITYLRDGKETTVKAKLKAVKSVDFKTSFNFDKLQGIDDLQRFNFQTPDAQNFKFNWGGTATGQPRLGVRIQDTEDNSGAKVLDVDDDGIGAKAGLKEGDVVTEIAGIKVSGADEARNAIRDNKEKGAFTIKVNRNGSPVSVDVKIPKKLKTANL